MQWKVENANLDSVISALKGIRYVSRDIGLDTFESRDRDETETSQKNVLRRSRDRDIRDRDVIPAQYLSANYPRLYSQET